MSATQLAAFIVGCATAAGLAAAAAWVALRSPRCPPPRLATKHALVALSLGLLAIAVFGVSVTASAVAADPPTGSPWSNRCEPGTYDNGGERYDGPICIPWPNGASR